ncbi:MAG: histone deacetylase [Candidatus Latescibacteria bacterium]|jgi:acetoin utilization deacetylase AcuC-like enzyme|nr:histone deacetylase [Candidatus Latescibacterota bacterium]
MSTVAFYSHDAYLDHLTGAAHPERPERLVGMLDVLQQSDVWDRLDHRTPSPALPGQIALAHSPDYVSYVEEYCSRGGGLLDGTETVVSKNSYTAAMLAAGAATDAIDAVMTGEVDRAFCAVRPPGHHAIVDRAMGFCVFNNVAVAARHCQKQHGVERVAILDWDYHHGNGTQFIFWADPSVWYGSLHASPAYPHTGLASERGGGEARRSVVNRPLPTGTGHDEYIESFDSKILPSLETFAPELILISAGFDSHSDDPICNMRLTEQTFAMMTESVVELADLVCHGRIVSVLEGGYHPQALGRSVECHLKTMLDR